MRIISCVQLFATPWTRQAPLSMGFSRQEYWSGWHFLLQGSSQSGDQTSISYASCIGRQILCQLSHLGSPKGWDLWLILVYWRPNWNPAHEFLCLFLWLHWVSIALQGFVQSRWTGSYSVVVCRLLLLWSTGSRHTGFSSHGTASVVAACGLGS